MRGISSPSSPLGEGARMSKWRLRGSLHVRADFLISRGKALDRENILYVARARQRDDVLGGNARGRAAEHQGAVAERDRFDDVVSDEDDGLAPKLPQVEQVGLELGAGLRVNGTARPSGSPAGRRPAYG